jgi:hypothetical protein
MTIAYSDANQIANDPDFKGRIAYAFIVQALSIMLNAPSPSVQQVAFCNQVINGGLNLQQGALAVLYTNLVASEATLSIGGPSYGIPDADLQTGVETVFNAMGGIPTN